MLKRSKNILFIGLGSIGQRHYRNLKKLGDNFKFFAIRKIKKSPELTKNNLVKHKKFYPKKQNIVELNEKESIKKKFDAVFICNPSSLHLKYALKFAKKGTSLFIEKPLSHNFKGVTKLEKIIKKNKIICAVGFQLRYHPFLYKIKKIINSNLLGKIKKADIFNQHYLPYHHKYEDYRNGYAAKKMLGGGVLLCFIHEIDYSNYLFENIKSVFCKSKKKSKLSIDVEDHAKLKCEYSLNNHKFQVNILLDFIRKNEKRMCKIFFERGEIIWNLKLDTLQIIKNKKIIEQKISNISRNTLFKKEIAQFIDNVKSKTKPKSNLENGILSLKVVILAKKSNKIKQKIYLN